jgi:hypothetical protein
MDPRHLVFLRRNSLDTYNNYFNRDKKRTILVPVELFMANGIPAPQRMESSGSSAGINLNDPFLHKFHVIYDPFLYEYRDGDTAVPRPPDNEKIGLEPEKSCYKNVSLEYIREHGALEFILESEYPYCLNSLFAYSKPSEYQMEYLRKLVKEGRLTQKVFRL